MKRPKRYEDDDYGFSCYRDGYAVAQVNAGDRLHHLSLAKALDGEAMREACARIARQLKQTGKRNRCAT